MKKISKKSALTSKLVSCIILSLCIQALVVAVVADDYGDIKFHYGDRSSFSPTEAVPFPNIGHVGRGYDFLYANPHSTLGSDPGFRLNIFDLDSGINTTGRIISGDGRFIIPANVSVFQDLSCSLSSEVQVISSMSSYSASLQASMSASIPFSGSFSMSAGFQYAQSKMSNSRFTKATGTCIVYSVEFHDNELPPLDPYFVREVIRVSKLSNPATGIPDIISQFGTHYITEATMGSIFGQQSEMNAKYFQSQTSAYIQASASASFDIASASASLSASYDQASDFSSNCTTQSLYTIGSLPPTNGNMDTWAAQSIVAPEVVGIQGLQLISSLFTTKNFPSISATILNSMNSTFYAKVNGYCASTPGATCTLSDDTKTDKCFGGWYSPQIGPMYTNDLVNIFTGARNCPLGYTSQGLYLVKPSSSQMYDLVYCVSDNHADCALSTAGSGATSFGGMFVMSAQGQCIPGSNTAPASNCQCDKNLTPLLIMNTGQSNVSICSYTQSSGGDGFGIGGGFQSDNINAPNAWVYFKAQSCSLLYSPYLFVQTNSKSPMQPHISYICLRTDNPFFASFSLPSPNDPTANS